VTVSEPIHFTYDALPGRVVFAPGAARAVLADEAARLGAERLLLIVTPGQREPAGRLTAPFAARVAGTFTGVRPHVPGEVAAAARTAADDVRADALLAVGGGSTIGTAKAIALTSGLPILAVPTTYAGSEMTAVWGLTEGARKTTGTDRRVLPRTVVYDPELTVTLPVETSAVSGLNALAHCVEAFWAPGRNPVSSLSAEEGIRALAGGLPAVAEDGGDLAARSLALYGAYLAGAAFAATGAGLHHKICHVLGGAFDLPHAQTHAVVLPYVLAFNEPAVPRAAARIALALGADGAATGLVALAQRLKVPRSLADLGLREDELDEAARLVMEKVPAGNPRPVTSGRIRRLLTAAWAGDDPLGYAEDERR
jgi:maleylacetate reductase